MSTRRIFLRYAELWAAKPINVVLTAYLVFTYLVALYVAFLGAAGPDDLFSGFALLALTAPLSIIAFVLLPDAWINTDAFIKVFALVAPALNALVFRLAWAGVTRLRFGSR